MTSNFPLFPPVNFCCVEEGLYRCGMPFELNFEFLKSLRLRTVILLTPESMDGAVSNFFEINLVNVIPIESTVSDSLRGLYPVAEEMVTESLKIISNSTNFPLLVVCKTGKALTGTVIACMRKMQHWSLISIFEEYRRFTGRPARIQQQHEQFIELFDIDLITITAHSPSFLVKSANLHNKTSDIANEPAK